MTQNLKCYAAIPDSTYCSLFGNEQIKDTTEEQRYINYYLDALLAYDNKNFKESLEQLENCKKISYNAALDFQLYKVYNSLQNDSLAFFHLKNATEKDKKNKAYLEVLGIYYWEGNDFYSAYEIYSRLHKYYPESSEYIYNILYCIKQLNGNGIQKKMYINMLSKLEEIDGYSPEIAFDRIKYYIASQEFKKVYAEIDKAINKFPYNNDFNVFKAQILHNQGEYTKALKSIENALSIEPNNGNIAYFASEIYLKEGDYKSADSLKVRAVNAANTDDELRVSLIKPIISQLYEDHNIEAIYRTFNHYITRFNENKLLKEYYITFLEKEMDSTNITKTYKELIVQDPNNPIYSENILQYTLNDIEYREHLVNYNDSVHNNDKWKYYKLMTYIIANDTLKIKKSAKEILPLVVGKQTSSTMYGIIGDYFLQTHDSVNKEFMYEMYDSALIKNPQNDIVLNNYAYMLFLNNKDLNKAEEMSMKSININPNSIASLDTYANILFQKKEYFLAKFYMEKLFREVEKPNSNNLELYGDILFYIGEKEKAIEYWEKASKADPNNNRAILKFNTQTYHE